MPGRIKDKKETEKQRKQRLLDARLRRMEKRIKDLEAKVHAIFDAELTPLPKH